ncbi:hypothetical protein WICPIJ_004938 [Wickerhamomyces pijperi]|uniref:Actin-like protein ARP6 n=1 Tax=Wickerhamomyces pijperi TaxID=599730 RepID=A0A9P8Q758_WICPI|nr:hypothetical protein WICPIJ_004938 [Wickerhamomyces pijperi]
MSTIIIDNGSYEIKIGHASNGVESVKTLQNSIIRTKDKRLLISNQLSTINDISGVQFKRPIERGQLVSWEVEKMIWDYAFESTDVGLNIDTFHDKDLILSEAPFTIPQMSMNSDQVVFEEYGFNSLYKSPVGGFVPFNQQNNEKIYIPSTESVGETAVTAVETGSYSDYQLVIDSGFNATWIIPMVKGVIYWRGVKKLDIGGRFLSGVLREQISFRHYNVTDETVLINNIKNESCFVSLDYNESLKKIKAKGSNKQDHVIEYVLPDFNTTTQGYVLTPELKEKYKPQSQQILKLYDERFTAPETLFHPEIVDVFNKAGIVETIIDSINTLPEIVRPLIVANIVMIGGNCNMRGFEQRLLNELKIVLPVEWEVRIGKPSNPSTYGRECASVFSQTESYQKVKITKKDYEEHGPHWVHKRFGYSL